jgi:putative sterol carrier protein
MKASSTYHLLRPFLEGMEAAGAETEVIHVRRLNLEACIGCYTCWVRTPGECIHDDSMTEALERFNSADMVVFGTPLYHFAMSGTLKNFIDRILPRLEPWLIPHPHVKGVTGHPERVHKPDKVFLISPCGFPEFEHFDSLVATFKQMARMENWEYVGEILRPGAEPLSRRSLQGLFGHYYDLVRRAGEQVVREGRISDEVQADLRQDLFPGGKQAFYDMAGAYWTQQMDRFRVTSEQRHTVPLLAADLDSVPMAPPDADVQPGGIARIGGRYYAPNELMMRYLAGMFDPQAVPDLRATIQIAFIPPQLALSETEGRVQFDPGPAEWHLGIGGGQCTVRRGRTAVPNLSITTPHEVWQDIGSGLLDAQGAFTEGRFEANGSMWLLEQFSQIFQHPQPSEGGGANPELDMIMLGMPLAFSAKAAAGLEATIQYVLSGEGGGMYHLRIKDGECTAHHGPLLEADLTIHAPARIWLAIAKGELDGQEAFMKGLYRASGDMSVMMKMGDLFSAIGGQAAPPEVTVPEAPAPQPTPTAEGEPLAPPAGVGTRPPETIHEVMAGMPASFQAQAAPSLVAAIQFQFSGEESGAYYLAIQDDTCAAYTGEVPDPTLTFHTPSEIWLAISRGELDGQQALMEGQYQVEGDLGLLMRMTDLFATG